MPGIELPAGVLSRSSRESVLSGVGTQREPPQSCLDDQSQW